MNRNDEVIQYFAKKVAVYDEVDFQPYWVFSDDLLWGILQSRILPTDIEADVSLLDAGCGTARWALKFLDTYQNASAYLIDFCPEMAAIAEIKLSKHGFASRSKVFVSNVADMRKLGEARFNIAISFHNVLGFVPDLVAVLTEIGRVLHPGGVAALMFPNLCHALYFSLSSGRFHEVRRIADKRSVCFTDDMPELRVFSINDIETAINDAHLSLQAIHGFPVTLFPGMEETTPRGSSDHLRDILEDQERRKQLYDIELSLCLDSRNSARGNNLLAFVTHRK